MSQQDNADRTIEKARDVLLECREYFEHQARMNATAHMAERVMHSPIHAAIDSVLHGIDTYQESYPNE